MRTYSYELISTTGVSTFVSTSAHKIDYTVGYAMQASYTGGLRGNLQLLSSNDGVFFTPIAGTLTSIASTGVFIWNVLSANYLYVQGQFLPTSASTGTLSFLINSKGF